MAFDGTGGVDSQAGGTGGDHHGPACPADRQGAPTGHFRRPRERPFTASEREHTTLLFIGLTWKHGRLIEAALEGLGYRVQQLPDPDRAAFQLGKEHGNPGQCNPSYFSAGCLIQHLRKLEAQGLSRRQICDSYVFLIAGACGPCRFGMYEAEYRLALRNAGFEDFRVVLFQQHGLQPDGEAAGLEVNADFMLSLVMSAALADLVNDMAYQIRPYEVEAGATNATAQRSIDELAEILRTRTRAMAASRTGRRRVPGGEKAMVISRLWRFTRAPEVRQAVATIGRRFGDIEVDRRRTRPLVKITGEFWAQTTEGDGNFQLLRFLEREGADVIPDPASAWLLFSVHQARVKVRDRLTLGEGSWHRRLGPMWRRLQTLLSLAAVDRLYTWEWNRLRRILGDVPRSLPDQVALRNLANPFYNYRVGGGEGHLEIGKNIYYHTHRLCHMVLSLKPFGCLPSTQSDGAQSAVTSRFPEMIFLPIETSGEGEINAHSRVQMALGDARRRARDEVQYVLERTGLRDEEIQAFVDADPGVRRAAYRVPKSGHLASVAANFLWHVAWRTGRVQRPEPDGPAPPSAQPAHGQPGDETPLLQIEGVLV